MRIALCNVPQKKTSTTFPPLGVAYIYNALKEAGYSDVHFYNIDYYRPSDSQIIKHIRALNPDIIGISAVVATSYKYLKSLSFLLKKHFPNKPLIIGGAMCASAEVILIKTAIDLCVIGEGEEIIVEICKYWDSFKSFDANDDLRKIKGIVYRDPNRKMRPVFTGYARSIPKHNIKQPDYDLLGQDKEIYKWIFNDPLRGMWFKNDPRTFEKHRIGQRLGYVTTSKGCVARCTFCQRWKKGYTVLDVNSIIEHMKYLKEAFNIGFFSIADENFGSNKRHVLEFVKQVKDLDVLWEAGGVRVKSADLEVLKKMKEAGCVAVLFGAESGSNKMLAIMEKNATVNDNLAALKAVHEAGLYTLLQIVVGMPGESNETIRETCDFVREAISIFAEEFPLKIWINYAGAFPGTPLYEYARQEGLIGNTVEEEEKYLLKISNVSVTEVNNFVNFSGEPTSEALIFGHRIITTALETYRKYSKYPAMEEYRSHAKDYFRLSKLNPIVLNLFRLIGEPMHFPWKVLLCYQREQKILSTLKLLFSFERLEQVKTQSLRKTVKEYLVRRDSTLQSLRNSR